MEVELVDGVIDVPYTEGNTPINFVQHLHYLRGMHGAVSFVWSECLNPDRLPVAVQFLQEPMGVDVSYHRLVRTTEWQYEHEKCVVIGRGVSCYTSGSSLHAIDLLGQWQAVERDPVFLRLYLADYYNQVFEEA